ncbi:uncharacterized protein J8A68_001335 [[Candida] subhashii]|uniref:LisH domain-containing protein n=1 Tax=[Candida] subhashii TaxID=561895 RepID=A0A8J5QGE3_9ASCO|nr:uncharacterized protein J8A68_001335 [[Candida] subhashii]KAG7665279.1 hypothetical protein J8A68_001335 [[Candida] subhashii]
MSSNHITTDVHKLIAHFLQENNYPETLKQFESEHGSPIEPHKLIDESLTQIIKDRINYNNLLPTQFESQIKLDDGYKDDQIVEIIKNQFRHWISPSPIHREKLIDLDGLVISSSYSNGLVYLSTSSCKVYVLEEGGNLFIHHTKFPVVIKKIIPLDGGLLLFVGMNGMFYLSELKDEYELNIISEFPAHTRLIVDAKYIKFNNVDYIITLGWDYYLRLIKLEDKQFTILSEIKLTQQGTCLDVINYENQLVIVLGKLENTLLDVYTTTKEDNQLKLLYKISLNDAEFTSSSFSPRFITIQYIHNTIPMIAIATSHEPYMRLIIVSLKEIDQIQKDNQDEPPIMRNQIIKNINTLSPQDKYSQPIIAWRLINPNSPNHPKNNGIWIMGDDGIIRGVDLLNDKLIIISDAHQGKIKEFITYFNQDFNERLISCGVDREVTIWK